MIRILAPTLCFFFLALPAPAHEFWIEPQQYQVESGQPVQADLLVGENFEGAPQVYFETRVDRFELVRDGTRVPYNGRMGDVPALQLPDQGDGLLVIAHETRATELKYKTWADFEAFATHKGYSDIRVRHLARGLPDRDFWESYTRHAKSLIAVGTGIGSDQPLGLETEFVALSNPYTDDLGGGFLVSLTYLGQPRADAQIEIFERAPDGNVTTGIARSDLDGRVRIPVRSGYSYLLDAVVLRPAPDGDRAVWQSLWAALTFAVP